MSCYLFVLLAFLAPEFTAFALIAYFILDTLLPRVFHEVIDTIHEVLHTLFSTLQEVFEPVLTGLLTILLRVLIIPDAPAS